MQVGISIEVHAALWVRLDKHSTPVVALMGEEELHSAEEEDNLAAEDMLVCDLEEVYLLNASQSTDRSKKGLSWSGMSTMSLT